jgi:general secretion pathway protein G
MKTLSKTKRAGFTLAEMMVVIVIIGILATIVVPNVMQKFFQSQRAKATADITQIEGALKEYAMANAGKYPDSLEALVTPDLNGYRYLSQKTIPKDPWGEEYGFDPPSPGNPEPRVFSLGKDKAPGGEGDDADIDSDTIREGPKK